MIEPSSAVQMWLWIGTIGMALGAVVFVLMAARERPGHRWFHTITFFIAAIAAVAYLGMSLKQGWFPILREGHEFYEPFYWARYVDWFFTTPLLLLDLALLAGASKEAIVWLIGLDIGMIATGFFAGVTSSDLRWVWFGVSAFIFVWILWVLLAEVLKAAKQRPPEVRAKFQQLAILLAVVWSVYPILWILGTEGLGVIGITPEVASFVIIDLIAKVGFGFLLLSNRKVLDAARPANV
ncbi:MAG: bacteriorhodopsin [Actinobacteria bacterium]|nr:bacteriorhodopsin [Actinomycetota bacterium]